MKFGYVLPNFGDRISASDLLQIATVCEEEGLDSVWATDHVIMPVELKEPYGQVLEPLTILSGIGARTKKVKLGTSILILPQRNPILVAKQVATLDSLSRGRVILGCGAGWAEKEFGYLNADFSGRGAVYDESIAVMRKLWGEDPVEFEGKFFRVHGALFRPKPAAGGVPIWIGGNSRTALSRAIRLGDGWHPVGPDIETVTKGVGRIARTGRKLTVSARMTTDVRKKREPAVSATGERRTVVSGDAADIRKTIEQFAAAGLEYYCAAILHPSAADIIVDLKKFASEVVRSYT